MQGVQLLDAPPAHGHRGVGQAHGGSPPGPAGAAAGGVVLRPLLAGQGGAATGPVAHRLGHAQLTVGDLAGELVVLGGQEGGSVKPATDSFTAVSWSADEEAHRVILRQR